MYEDLLTTLRTVVTAIAKLSHGYLFPELPIKTPNDHRLNPCTVCNLFLYELVPYEPCYLWYYIKLVTFGMDNNQSLVITFKYSSKHLLKKTWFYTKLKQPPLMI